MVMDVVPGLTIAPPETFVELRPHVTCTPLPPMPDAEYPDEDDPPP